MDYADEMGEDYGSMQPAPSQSTKVDESADDDLVFIKPPPPPSYVPCDTETTLYVLQPNKLDGINEQITSNISRSFYAKKIPNSNLLLIVIDVLMRYKGDQRLSVKPKPIEYDLEFPCYKLNMSFYERRRIEECFTEHKDVSTYKLIPQSHF